jgi:hypothetical protein
MTMSSRGPEPSTWPEHMSRTILESGRRKSIGGKNPRLGLDDSLATLHGRSKLRSPTRVRRGCSCAMGFVMPPRAVLRASFITPPEPEFAPSRDGTAVPCFQIGPKDLQLNGQNPALLDGYGSFEVSLTPQYDGAIGRSWLKRGGGLVIANNRCGEEIPLRCLLRRNDI